MAKSTNLNKKNGPERFNFPKSKTKQHQKKTRKDIATVILHKEKSVALKTLIKDICELQKKPDKDNYRLVVDDIKIAKKLGNNVNEREKKLPRLEKRATLGEIRKRIKIFKEEPMSISYRIIEEEIKEAKQLGCDIAIYEKELLELEKEIPEPGGMSEKRENMLTDEMAKH
ncbi:MAG: hypothetical protein NTY80_03120 [candidate division SR1 bacterium]|nr:hypothetical protein [candidate division SR1 bacterium]